MIKIHAGKFAVAATLIFGSTMFSAPASAQVPFVQTCNASFASVSGSSTKAFGCGAVVLELRRIIDVRCARNMAPFGAPWRYFSTGITDPGGTVFCNELIDHAMRARSVVPAGGRIVSAQAFSVNPGTCNPGLTGTFSTWCSFGRSTPQTVVMVSVTAPR